MSVADTLVRIRERMAEAATRVGRSPSEVTLVGVTKYVDSASAAELVRAGCCDLGESRPQELWRKHEEVYNALEPTLASKIRWHLIGHLQRNKVRRTLPLAHMIHSVDSERLLATIDESADAEEMTHGDEPRARRMKILLEVNMSGESAKHGLAPYDVPSLLAGATRFAKVEICGLMTMAALPGGETAAVRSFAALRNLRDELQRSAPAGVQLSELSMGMSGDFEVAIAEGATMVRVGSALWDDR